MCLAARLLNLKSGKSIIQQGAFEKDSTGDSVSKCVGVILEIHHIGYIIGLRFKFPLDPGLQPLLLGFLVGSISDLDYMKNYLSRWVIYQTALVSCC